VLDLGCGSGSVSAALDLAGYEVTGVDGHLPRVLEAAQRSPRASFFVHDLERGVEAFRRDFDAVGLFDVIEHLDAPRAALGEAVTCVRPGGWVVGTVPAMRALWSQADVFAAHRRRFEARELANELARVEGADVVEVRPFFRSLVPLLFAQRRVVSTLRPLANAESYVTVPPAPVNLGLRALLRLERGMAPLLDVARRESLVCPAPPPRQPANATSNRPGRVKREVWWTTIVLMAARRSPRGTARSSGRRASAGAGRLLSSQDTSATAQGHAQRRQRYNAGPPIGPRAQLPAHPACVEGMGWVGEGTFVTRGRQQAARLSPWVAMPWVDQRRLMSRTR
jgi:SAM-dependent methyltransferase